MSAHQETPVQPVQSTDDTVIDLTDEALANAPVYAANPMAIETPTEAPTEIQAALPAQQPVAATPTLADAPIDAFDAEHHKGILDRLEHELALVDAALSHIDEDEMDAAETAIKELARHNDDGQVALPLR